MESRPSTSKRVKITDNDYEETVMKSLEEVEDDTLPDNDELASDIESDCKLVIESEHDSYSIEEDRESDTNDIERENENELNDETSKTSNENVSGADRKQYFEKNKFSWTAEPSKPKRKTQKRNIISQRLGL